MIGFSPKGVLEAILVFPTMGIIALCLDGIGLILFIVGIIFTGGALDDYGILDITGFLIFGTWIFIRSYGEREASAPSKEKSAAPAKAEQKVAGKELTAPAKTAKVAKPASKATSRMGKILLKVGLRAGVVSALEFIPDIGNIIPMWVLLVIFEFFSDLKNFSLAEGD